MKKDLVQIIKDNPGATARVDNDWWRLCGPETEEERAAWEAGDDATAERLMEERTLASSDDEFTNPAHGGICHGAGILHALAERAGIKVKEA
jgi:hypothetical protein